MAQNKPIIFSSNDKPFREWIKRNPDGFVLNAKRTLGANYLWIHHGHCQSLSGYTRQQREGAFTERTYIKICSNSAEELALWVRRNRSRIQSWQACGRCTPNISVASVEALTRGLGSSDSEPPATIKVQITWREAVSEGISRLTLRRGSNLFTRQLLLDEELPSIVGAIGSSGKTPTQTISRVLQELRDDKEIEFVGKGEYRLLASALPPSTEEAESDGPTTRISSVVSRIIRDTAIVRRLKIKYGFRCQICGERIELKSGFYCEAHHLRPLGSPHDGPDVESNLIVVCPNHHTQLDFMAIPVNVADLKHHFHAINPAHIEYHNQLYWNGFDNVEGSP